MCVYNRHTTVIIISLCYLVLSVFCCLYLLGSVVQQPVLEYGSTCEVTERCLLWDAVVPVVMLNLCHMASLQVSDIKDSIISYYHYPGTRPQLKCGQR